jgi:hypothetical protein
MHSTGAFDVELQAAGVDFAGENWVRFANLLVYPG